jgi:hypothetical protein
MSNTLVSELKIGDVVCINEVFFIVREKTDRVTISKTTAAAGHGLMSLSFSSHNYDDLKNRVMLAGKAL